MPDDPLPFALDRVFILNYRAISKAEFNLMATNLIVGINGAGKTSILRAMAFLLEDLSRRIGPSTTEGQQPNFSDARKPLVRTRAFLKTDGQEYYLRREWKTVDGTVSESKLNAEQSQTSTLARIYWSKLQAEDDEVALPLLCFYPIGRTVQEIPLKARTEVVSSRREGYVRAFTAERHFGSFFQWFRELEDVENEQGKKRDPHLQAVRRAVEAAMPGYTNLRVSRRPRLRMLVDKGEEILSIQQLSDGEQGVLTLVGDLARRAAILNPHLPDPLLSPGCVLVDEIDQHLHPQWQRRVVETMRRVFPNVQFVFTSHSPIVCGSVEPDSLLILKDGKVERGSVYGWSVAEILKTVFEVDERPAPIHDRLVELDRALDADDLEGAKRIVGSLREHLPETDPEIVRANVLIPMLQVATEGS